MSRQVAPPDLDALAADLRRAEAHATPILPLTSTADLTVKDAYRVQSLNVAARLNGSGATHVAGHKIGLTSLAMQQMLGVDEPDYGVLYEDRIHTSGARLDTATLIAPRVEPEFAFILDRDLEGPDVTVSDVRAATGCVVPALEVIDSRIADWKIGLADTIADNASCHCAVLGTDEHAISSVDLPASAVQLRVDGVEVLAGNGSAVLGDPATAVAWLAAALHRHDQHLRAGDVVLSGSMTAAVDLRPGSHVVADFGPLGTVEVST